MKKAIYFSTATLLLILPGIGNAQSSENLSPTEVFCSNLSRKSGNAVREMRKMTKSNKLSSAEKQILSDMSRNLGSSETIENICFPAQL